MGGPRHTTDIQLADGTVISGSRIEASMRDLTSHYNAIPKGDLANRWVQNTYVMGYSPQRTGDASRHHFPWLAEHNASGLAAGGTALRGGGMTNFHRVKACEMPGIDPGQSIGEQYVWTTAFYFAKPVILHSIDLILHLDHEFAPVIEYSNTYTYGSPAPDGYVTNEPSKDVALVLAVDSPFRREDRSQADVEVARVGFAPYYDTFSFLGTNPATADMQPQVYPGGYPAGKWIGLKDLNVPLRQDARARLSIVIPKYDGTDVDVSDWTAKPWYAQAYTLTVKILEEVEE